ncbi:helix-turn-helix domain-containing protein [Methylovirgula sp. HY1]|uniref:helix-turn-helix domain-containing protein n=1 Tax=Methylovirgula sp. HY1 TaxID=2822761 RepID=UPI001C5A7FDA|nr:helix-turn-helix transcriptional regulator [Methylovirgula sp. HY1]QXX74263.1 hypothetical protein MHY1_01073 [Methylovirgula sp. HY1]
MGKPNRITEWRERREMTLEALAERAGISTTYLWRIENGERNLSLKNLKKLASALSIQQKELVPGEVKGVPLVGFVGAGAETHRFDDGQGPFDEVEAPDGATDKTVAVEIRGESLGVLFDRWLVFYDDVRRPVTTDLIGVLCVVGLADGHVLIKKIEKGQLKGRFTLRSNIEPPIYDAEIIWAARVKQMRPR